MSNGTIPPSQTPRVAVPVSSGNEQVVKIVRLPDALQNVARAQRVEGEVVKQNADGTIRLKTAEGDIDITVRGRQPQPGQKIEIDIPAGRPPRQAIIRPAPVSVPTPETVTTAPIRTPVSSPLPPQAASSTARPYESVTPAPSSSTSSAVATPATAPSAGSTTATPTPRPGTPIPAPALPPVLNDAAASPAPAAAQSPLSAGATVRLTPLTPAQAQSMLANYAATLPVIPTTMARAQLAASVLVQNVSSDMTRALLTTPVPTLPPPTAAVLLTTSTVFVIPPKSHGSPPGHSALASLTTTSLPPTTPQIFSPSLLTIDQPALTIARPATPLPGRIPSSNISSGIQMMDVKVLSFTSASITLLPPGTPPLAAASHAGVPFAPTQMPAGYMTAQVVGITPQQLPIVSLTPPGQATPQFFVLQFSATNMPVGTFINVSALPVTTPPSGVVPVVLPSTLAGLVSSMTWPALDEMMTTLSHLSPAAAASLIRTIPTPGNAAQMGPAALLFMAAIKAGDLSGWIGERRIDALTRAGKTALITRMAQDGATLSRIASEPVSGDWRGMIIPLNWQGEVHKVMLYTRRDGTEQNGTEHSGGGQTRFIFDLSLSRMGDVQIDGLARGDRLDMVVRSQHPFSGPMQAAMRAAYVRALDDTPLHGELTFQGDPRGWVNVVKRTETVGVEI